MSYISRLMPKRRVGLPYCLHTFITLSSNLVQAPCTRALFFPQPSLLPLFFRRYFSMSSDYEFSDEEQEYYDDMDEDKDDLMDEDEGKRPGPFPCNRSSETHRTRLRHVRR